MDYKGVEIKEFVSHPLMGKPTLSYWRIIHKVFLTARFSEETYAQVAWDNYLDSVATLRQLVKDLKEDAIALAEDYCPSWEQNHAKTCPQSLLGKHYGREKEPCNCGYVAKYEKHAALVERTKGIGIE